MNNELLNNENLLSSILMDLKEIEKDITAICSNIKSSPLTKSTNHLLELLQSIELVLKEK